MPYPLEFGVPLSVTRSTVTTIGLWSPTASCTWDGATLHVLEVLYSFSADFHFNPGFTVNHHKQWPYDTIITGCEAYFYPSGLPGVCGWSSSLWRLQRGTGLAFMIDYGVGHTVAQLFNLPPVAPAGRFDQILPPPV
jgi:hypothetical protein